MYELAVSLVTEVMEMAVPVAIVFELGQLVVGTFLRAAFGGKLWFGKVTQLSNGAEGVFIKNERFNTTLVSFNFYMPFMIRSDER